MLSRISSAASICWLQTTLESHQDAVDTESHESRRGRSVGGVTGSRGVWPSWGGAVESPPAPVSSHTSGGRTHVRLRSSAARREVFLPPLRRHSGRCPEVTRRASVWQPLGPSSSEGAVCWRVRVCARSVSRCTANLPRGLFCSAIQGSSLGGSRCRSSSLRRSFSSRHPIIPSAPSQLLASLGSPCPSAKAAELLCSSHFLLLIEDRSTVSNLR